MIALILRPLTALVGALVLTAALRALPSAAGAAEAGWFQVTAAVQLALLPYGVIAALLLGAATRAVPAGRVRRAAILYGAGLVLLPDLAALAGRELEMTLSLVLVVTALVGAILWARRGGPDRIMPGGHAFPAAAAAALLLLPLGFLLPGPPLDFGELEADAAAPAGPNLALVVLDTLRADRMGSYGCERDTSPFLDGLAARGIRYTHAASTASHTPPGHAGMFTGLLPSEHGVMSSKAAMSGEHPTLAERLGAAGYHTAGVVANFVIRSGNGFERGFAVYDDGLVANTGMAAGAGVALEVPAVRTLGNIKIAKRRGTAKALLGLSRTRGSADAEEVNARAIAWMDAAAADDRPFFLFLNYMDVHGPYQAPGEYFDRYLEHDPGRFRERLPQLQFAKLLNQLGADFRAGKDVDEEIAALLDRYDGELAYLDSQLAALVAHLEAVSGERGWLLVVTSDHGEHFGENGALEHGEGLHEPVLHVPLIVAGSAVTPAVVEESVTTLDVAGTLLAAAGLESIGRSMDLLAGTERPIGHVAAEHGDPRGDYAFGPLTDIAIYEEIGKVLFHVDGEGAQARRDGEPVSLGSPQVFDLAVDPGEEHPLEGARLPVDLLHWSEEWLARYLEGRKKARKLYVGEADAAALNSLGYATVEEEPPPPQD